MDSLAASSHLPGGAPATRPPRSPYEPPLPVLQVPPGFIGRWEPIYDINEWDRLIARQPTILDFLEPRDNVDPDAARYTKTIRALLDEAFARSDGVSQPVLFTYDVSKATFRLSTNYPPAVAADLRGGVPTDSEIKSVPKKFRKWPTVPYHLVVVPPSNMGSLDMRIDLMNKQVEYWTHSIFLMKQVMQLKATGPQRKYLVNWWLGTSGQSLLYQRFRGTRPGITVAGQVLGPEWNCRTVCIDMRRELKETFKRAGCEQGVNVYGGNFDSKQLVK